MAFFSVFGDDSYLKFHPYGLLIGLAALVGDFLASIPARKYGLTAKQHEQALFWAALSGFIGARLWHVLTDFELYATELYKVAYVWNGGMSIIGGIVGGVFGLYIYTNHFLAKNLTTISRDFSANLKETTALNATESRKFFLVFIDTAVFGLPVAQAIGRLGNYVNHELFGLPTSLAWGIFIPPEYRPVGFETATYFHPLFAYEMIFTLGFAVVIWWLEFKRDLQVYFKKSSLKLIPSKNLELQKNEESILKIGSGRLACWYILYYAGIRFCLDFLRIDRGAEVGGLGFNQAFLLLLFLVVGLVLWKKQQSA